MDKQIRYHPLFDCDVREAARWYDKRSPDLGNAFVGEVQKCTAEVIASPERFASLPSGCRYKRLRRFPYVLLFDLLGNELLILAVLHTARSQEKWRERIE